MKSLSSVVLLFFWGMVIFSVSEMIPVWPHFTEQMLRYTTMAMWLCAVVLVLRDVWSSWRHVKATDVEGHREV
ncbi:hypothetical protein [Siccibacter turicensis]|uniref:hypothetical protein n=1 Tax=Siccibacter TaxID=1649298 RepID=UPI0004658752|nr:hypothetical protein [Siccibacter turicensis]